MFADFLMHLLGHTFGHLLKEMFVPVAVTSYVLEMLAALWLASSVGTTNLLYLSTFVGYACFCLYKLVRQLRKYYAQHEIIWPPLGYRQLVVKCAYGVGLIGGLCAMHWGVRESSWLIGLLGLGATLYFGLTIYLAPKDD